MRSIRVVEGNIAADEVLGFTRRLVGVQVDFLVLERSPNRSTKTLSTQLPLPSMLSEMLSLSLMSLGRKSESVNCDPWSVLKISGQPYLESSSRTASTQKSVVSVFDIRQDKTRRVAQSRTAKR